MSEELSEQHLADLHARAAEQGIEGYRLLRREELIERLQAAPPRRRRGRRGGRNRSDRGERAGRERLSAEPRPRSESPSRRQARPKAEREPEDEQTVSVTGILELTRQRHGFIRAPGLGAREDDVYVSASQVRRCELRSGDEVTGPARKARRGERHRALVHVDTVNGGPPQEEGRVDFDSLTPVAASRRIALGPEAGALARAADLLAPLAYGQRALVRAAPRSGRTTLLRELAAALAETEGTRVIALLIDERPEELPDWHAVSEALELALAPADLAPREQVRVAELAVDRARRLAESGVDVVLLCDSLSRLAVAAEGAAEVKRLFGSGRDLAEDGAGSLTVIATVFADGEDEGSASRAVSTTETSLVTLDESLAEEGIVPALSFADCRVVGEESLLAERELEGLRHLRTKLRDMVPPEAAAYLRERIEASASNQALLENLA